MIDISANTNKREYDDKKYIQFTISYKRQRKK